MAPETRLRTAQLRRGRQVQGDNRRGKIIIRRPSLESLSSQTSSLPYVKVIKFL